MKIRLNGTEKEVNGISNLQDLINKVLNGRPAEGIAVAVNYKVIHRQDWKSTSVNEGDEIEIVTAMQGG